MLLRHGGIDVNARDGEGFTPLQVASKFGRDEVATLLVEHGADTTGYSKVSIIRNTPLLKNLPYPPSVSYAIKTLRDV